MGVPVRPRLAVQKYNKHKTQSIYNLTHFCMKNRFLPFLFLMFACVYSLALRAASEVYDVWDGTTKTAVVGTTVYTITSADELAWLANQDQDFLGITIELQANIDLNGQVWKPIGTATKPFKGTFKGKGHLIKGLRLFNATDGVGLFGHVAQGATIDSLGISGGNLVAKNKRRVGAIAGVCAGHINQCWSMAEIAVAGNVVGGLVGELTATGVITDAYNAGLILNANDTIGGIVGRNNRGTLTRVFNTGYAKNGYALVGIDLFGTYTNCRFDRKLYYQQSGIANDPQTPEDVTVNMFTLYAGNPAWSNGTNRYPVLSAFQSTDAALLSAAPMFIEANAIDPVNHANDLTLDFTVSTDGGVVWTCEDKSAERWIAISGSDVEVTRPCSETDVLVDKTLRNEMHIVYMRPRRTDDLLAGEFISYNPESRHTDVVLHFCYDGNHNAKLSTYSNMSVASRGWLGDGDYTYQVERMIIDSNNDTTVLDTLLLNANTSSYRTWYNNYMIDLSRPGHYILRSYVKDNGCVSAWLENPTGIEYIVYEEFVPGKINSDIDTVILDNVPYLANATSFSVSHGGNGEIVYWWMMNGDTVVYPSPTALNLVNYKIYNPGVYRFTRGTMDEACYTPNFLLSTLGEYVVYAFLPLDPGEVNPTNDTTFCSVDDAKAYIIKATAATGGITDKGYSYQWYKVNGTDTTAISGATNQNLSLNLTSLNLEAGKTYTFIRKAWDNTHWTKWTVSRYQRKIHIMAALNPGAIQDGALADYCAAFDATNSTMITVNVGQVTAASGDDNLQYRWTYNNGSGERIISGATSATLSYQVRLIDVIGKTLVFHRDVRNPNCDWQRSSGAASMYFGQDTRDYVTFTVCESELPYSMTWIDGSEHKFYNDGDVWTVSDTWTNRCAKDTTFKVVVAQRPNFTFNEDYVSWCQTTGTMAVYYNDDPAIPSNYFYIRYSDDLKAYMGKADTTGAITTPGMIQFDNMPSLGTGDLYLMVQIGYSANSGESTCFSSSRQLRLYPSLGGYLYSKYDRVVFVDNNPENGALPETTEKLEFVSYQWYKNGIPQEGMTDQYYHENGAILNGVFYCMLKDTKDKTYRTCDITLPADGAAAAPQRCYVYPVPANAGQTITIECTGDARIISFSGECVLQAHNIEEKITVSAPRVPGMYYVEIRDAEGGLDIHKLIVK